ncbi:uncharacterized protein LOC117182645 [Belonocnema kinseyi]|uniref:uncharacterized protein LOC117182645 n=1 Tax=Belonocnema kinseyi TaxID=2817044 RepID=UPI00143D9FB2|nr:uncharacterized protein LOC117182645 [Belonocnema kinseyi]
MHFFCLATRAIHIEVVSGYTAKGFIAAIRRFSSRRGYAQVVYSDKAKNFVGASREPQRAFRKLVTDHQLHSAFALDGLTWKFIPSTSHDFGGLWEAGVKSIKHHLRRVIKNHILTFDELTKLTWQIEACLNFRPIGPVSHETDRLSSLTPGHFLNGGAPLSLPERSMLDLIEQYPKCWKLFQQRLEQFWRLWRHDYLNTLQQRNKWRHKNPNLEPGTLVLIKNEDLPPGKLTFIAWAAEALPQCQVEIEPVSRRNGSKAYALASTTVV